MAREGELHLEGLPLRQVHAEDVVEDEPLDLLVAVGRGEAPVIASGADFRTRMGPTGAKPNGNPWKYI